MFGNYLVYTCRLLNSKTSLPNTCNTKCKSIIVICIVLPGTPTKFDITFLIVYMYICECFYGIVGF